MSARTRKIRRIAASAAIPGCLALPLGALGDPVLSSNLVGAHLQLAAVYEPPRVLRTRSQSGRPVEMEQRLHILREHGRNKRRNDRVLPLESAARPSPTSPATAPNATRKDPVE